MTFKQFEIERIHKKKRLNILDYGSKAAQIRSLVKLGLPVPPGFLVPRDLVHKSIDYPGMRISEKFDKLEGIYAFRASPVKREWGSIDALLNLGLNDDYIKKISSQIGKITALELYMRFIHNFGILVHGLEPEIFESIAYNKIHKRSFDVDSSPDERTLLSIIELSKNKFKQEAGVDFPQDVNVQIDKAFLAMSRSWYRPSAMILRRTRGAPDNAGVGLILQRMVLGIGPKFSGSGQVKTIDSYTGKSSLTGHFSMNSQGNNSISGICTSYVLTEQQRIEGTQTEGSLEVLYPSYLEKIKNITQKLQMGLGDVFELEFIIEKNKLYLLDAVIAERSARASVRVAVDLVKCKAISEEQALLKVAPQNLVEFLHPQVSKSFLRDLVGSGLPASPGAITGRVAFSSQFANSLNAKGEPAILVRIETSPEDIAGIHDSVGVLTTRGGMTSHAAVIARGLGLPCVVGVSSLTMNVLEKTMVSDNGHEFKEGDLITLDGTAGEVLYGHAEMTPPEISGAFSTLMEWADRYRNLAVRGNADTLQEVKLARDFGADGIGLCRTEHMFFEPERLLVMRQMILADGEKKRNQALQKLLPMQRDDFIKIFQIIQGQPVTIRLLDPPLHEFLPHSEEEMRSVAISMNESLEDIIERSKDLEEFNPMLGKRGVRLGVTLPQIYEMQARAIFEAAIYVNQKGKKPVIPEIMIPLVSSRREVDFISGRIASLSKNLSKQMACPINYKLGVVLETPRAALKAYELSTVCDFLSFGTNDLTQMTYGLSRDDAGRFMRDYLEKEIFPSDPFHTLDKEGVGELMLIAAARARRSDKNVELGLCGEHGGDPSSINFCFEAGFDYVSCSPFRIPIARLAAAHAFLNKKSPV